MSSSLPEEPFTTVSALLRGFPSTWFLCGGWATDAWLGHQTRKHGDVDIAIFAQDQAALFAHLPGWFMVGHDGGSSTDRWDGAPLALPAHIHARPPGETNRELVASWLRTGAAWAAKDGFDYEFILNERDGEEWVLSRTAGLSVPLARSFRDSPAGLPALVPELIMFFKATAYWGPAPTSGEAIAGHPRPRDLQDFTALAPLLSAEERAWLYGAVATIQPGHPWLALV